MTRRMDERALPSVLLPVDDLQPGMPVVEDVYDQQGRLLMSAGTELTERHLRACQLWGITRVRVRAEGLPAEVEPAGPTPEQLAAAERMTEQRFRNTDSSHPVVQELYRICVIRAAEGAARAGSTSHG